MFGILWQVAAAVDSQAAQATAIAEEHGTATPVVVKNPVPGFAGRVFQFAFSLPQWIQWSLIALGALVALAICVLIFRQRESIFAWLTMQSRGYKSALASVVAVLMIGAVGVGFTGWHYTQHNNDFCVGCHVMGKAWNAFQRSEHRKLECHNCHQQPITASVKQLYYWVLERPDKIPKHAKVPTAVCSQCHVQSLADSSWKRIIATAGHRLHMKSDSSALKNVACVTCHGQEVHRFKPVDKTCGQTGCHQSKDTKIVLGKMAGQTSQHCTGCHTFTRPVPENISMDSTRKFLMATGSPESCFRCHEMRDKLKGFDPQTDRGHKGVCGSCHNPHKQNEPKAAFASCASGGCHSDLASKSPFHSKKSAHKTSQCGDCHQPHEWKPKGRECIDCHKGIFNTKPASASPARRDGATENEAPVALRPAMRVAGIGPMVGQMRLVPRGRRNPRSPRALRALFEPSADRVARLFPVARQQRTVTPPPKPAQDISARKAPKDNPKFSHGIHKVLACAGCHDQKVSPGGLTVRTAADCAACHHSAERSVTCEGCHNVRAQLVTPFARDVSMHTNGNAPPLTRKLSFAHRNHRDLECKGCHTSGILLGVTRDCQSCHTDHHNAERACTACHQVSKTVHQRASHDGCAGSGCHTNATVVSLPPSRTVCLVCHADQVNHKPKRECAECHAVKWGPAANVPR